jgi:hypothetical protein
MVTGLTNSICLSLVPGHFYSSAGNFIFFSSIAQLMPKLPTALMVILFSKFLRNQPFDTIWSVVDSSVGRVLSFSHEGPGSNLGADICSFRYLSVILLIVKLMSINGQSICVDS